MTLPDVARFQEPELTARDDVAGPPDAVPGACYGRDITPAVVETVTEQVMVQPPLLPEAGTQAPATYRTVTDHRIVQNRRDVWFQTPCPVDLTPQFIASLQRALAARGHFSGVVTGQMDTATRHAVRRFQKGEGLNSDVISTAAAKRLGLVVYERHEAIGKLRG